MEKAIGWLFPNKSFYTKVVTLLLPFTVFVCLLYSLLIGCSIKFVEDQIITDYLEREWQAIEYQSTISYEDLILPNTSYISTYRESDPNLPKEFVGLAEGNYEFVYDDTQDGQFPRIIVEGVEFNHDKHDFHLKVAKLSPESEKLYLLLTENKLSSINRYESLILSIIYAIAGIVVILGSLLAITIARYISEPIQTLSKEVDQAQLGRIHFKSEKRKDEIGRLATKFSELLSRLNESVEREKAFTRHASHELRTPLTVASNSLAVLALPSISDAKRETNIKRLKSSLDEMGTLIEVFLLLGRNSEHLQLETIDIKRTVEHSIERYTDQLTEGQSYNLDLEDTSIEGVYLLLVVVTNNLIRNSIYHGEGVINIHLNNHELTISNKSNHTNSGYGYGLEIIERISNIMHWSFEYHEDNGTFQTKLMFH